MTNIVTSRIIEREVREQPEVVFHSNKVLIGSGGAFPTVAAAGFKAGEFWSIGYDNSCATWALLVEFDDSRRSERREGRLDALLEALCVRFNVPAISIDVHSLNPKDAEPMKSQRRKSTRSK